MAESMAKLIKKKNIKITPTYPEPTYLISIIAAIYSISFISYILASSIASFIIYLYI